jgi:nitroreductase
MDKTTTDTQNQMLDQIIASRRSIRDFTDEVPSRACVEAILAAGLAGPFVKAAQGERTDYRRFVVLPKGSAARTAVVALLREKATAQIEVLRSQVPGNLLLQRLYEGIASGTLPGLAAAPYVIAVAERKGLPPGEALSIAPCLQNMWLKATALGLGFQIISQIAMLGDEPRFWAQVGLPPDSYAVNGCAIGMPRALPSPIARPKMEEAVIG